MFDLVFDAIASWNALGLLLGGLVLLAVGAVILCDQAWWFGGGHLAQARVTAILQSPDSRKEPIYYPVIAWRDGKGAEHEALPTIGSSAVGHWPGQALRVLARPDKPWKVRIPGLGLPVAGAAFTGAGLWLLGLGVKASPHLGLSIGGALALAAFGAWRFWRNFGIHDKAERAAHAAAFMDRPRRRLAEGKRLNDTELAALRARQARANRAGAWVLLGFGLGALALGGWLGRDLAALESSGQRAPGQVIGLEASDDPDGGTVWYPLVRFAPAGGAPVEFRGRTGTSPPLHQRGEAVTVLYDPADASRAMIDSGPWNWALPGGVGAGGLLMLVLGARILARRPRRL